MIHKTVVVLAAGMGSRYGGLKQLDGVGPSGETIIDYSVFDAKRAGFSKVVFIIRKEYEEVFRTQIGNKYQDQLDVRYVFQELEDLPEGFSVPPGREKPWGTAHAVLTAEKEVSDPFIIINADDFYGYDAFRKASEYLEQVDPDALHAAMVGYQLKNTLSEHGRVSRGVCEIDETHHLTGVSETHGIEETEERAITCDEGVSLQKETIVSMNFWIFTDKIFSKSREYFIDFLNEKQSEAKAEFYIPTVVNNLIHDESLPVEVVETEARWFGVTYREDRELVVARLKELADSGDYPSPLW